MLETNRRIERLLNKSEITPKTHEKLKHKLRHLEIRLNKIRQILEKPIKGTYRKEKKND